MYKDHGDGVAAGMCRGKYVSHRALKVHRDLNELGRGEKQALGKEGDALYIFSFVKRSGRWSPGWQPAAEAAVIPTV